MKRFLTALVLSAVTAGLAAVIWSAFAGDAGQPAFDRDPFETDSDDLSEAEQEQLLSELLSQL